MSPPLPLAVLAAVLAGVWAQSDCPAGWHVYGYRCYGPFANPKTFDEAAAACAAGWPGARLASVHSTQENWFIGNVMTLSNMSRAWIGLKYDPIEKQYVFIDGTGKPHIKKWNRDKEPKQPLTNNCVVLRGGVWRGLGCGTHNRKPYMCAAPKGTKPCPICGKCPST